MGGDGDDLVIGGRGRHRLPGRGNGTFIGIQATAATLLKDRTADAMIFNGANVAEKVDISANGSRVRFTRDVAAITMDLSGVERVDFNALGGADTITVNNLAGTDLTAVNLSLSGSDNRNGDGAADSVIFNGSDGNDTIHVASQQNGTVIAVGGPAFTVNIRGAEGANDSLTVNALGGDDRVDASGLAAGLINLTINGARALTLTGSQGNDLVSAEPARHRLHGRWGRYLRLESGRRQRHC